MNHREITQSRRAFAVRLGAVFVLAALFGAILVCGFAAGAPVGAQSLKVGLMTDEATLADKSFNWLSYQGLVRAEAELGVVGTVYTSTSSADYGPNLQQCVDDGNSLCISVGFLTRDAIWDAAVANPGTTFAIVDSEWSEEYPPNLRGMAFAEGESGYLAGTLAGLMTGSDVVGVVGGIPVPPVVRFVEGYRNGAQCANAYADVLMTYADSFEDPEQGAQIAQEMIGSGADVIFGAAGLTGNGAVLTATQSGVWGIGVDTDQYVSLFDSGGVAGAENLLSSAMKRLDNAVYDTISDLISGSFTAGTVLYDLAVDGVGLAPFHETDPLIPQEVRDTLAAVEQGIVNGTIDIWEPCRELLRVRVNQSHNWVDGETRPGSTIVATVWRDGVPVMSETTSNGEGTWWNVGFCCGEEYELRTGDVVEVETSLGLTASVEIIPMTGAVDANEETISGQLSGVDFPADVRGEVWAEGGPGVDGQSDEFGNYTIDFGPYDVREGYNVALWYIRPDGHEVGIVRSALRVGADISDDNVWGYTAPGATVDITASDSSGPKGAASTTANDEGEYWADLYADGARVDLLPGDSIQAVGAGYAVTLVVPDPFSAQIDVDADTVSGTGPAGTDLRVDVYGYGDKWVTVEPDGTWSAWFGDRGDLQNGDQGEVNYYAADGHEVRVRFYSPFLRVRVNESHNWVDGETTSDSTIVATVWRQGLPVMAGSAGNGGGTWWNVGFCCGEEYELRTGDVVEVETSLGLTATVEIIPITGAVDANADSAFGQLLDVPFPADVRGEVWEEGGPSVDVETDESGNYSFSFPFDVQPGHMVFLSYVRPDGHQVGIIRHGLRLNVDAGRDRVDGHTVPNTPVTVTINGGEMSTATSDADGNFDMQFSGEIAVGDTVAAEAGAQSTGLEVVDVTAQVDDANDRVWGYGPPSPGYRENINVGVNDDWRWTSTDPTGYFEVHYDRDITPDDRLEVEYRYPEGHQTRYGFGSSDVRVDKWAPVWSIVRGDVFTYVIRYSNDWSGPATDVVITDTLPYSVTYIADTSGVPPTYNPFENTLVWQLGELGGGREKSFELRVQMDETAYDSGPYRNRVEISAPNDRDTSNNRSEMDVSIWGPWADLWVAKSLAEGLPIAGEVITYQLRYGNYGSRPAADVVLTDTLPAGTAFTGSTFEAGVDGLAEHEVAGTVIWEIGTLEAGEEREFELAVRINEGTLPGTFLIDEISISDDPPEGENRDNRRRLATVVETPAADLWLDKEIEGDLFSPDNEIIYRATFGNAGTAPAENVVLTDILPSSMVHVWHSAGSVATAGDGQIVWELGTVPPGGGGQLLFGAQLTEPIPDGMVFTNSGEASTSTPELDYENNLAQARLGPPDVVCVPWVGDEPHRVWSGLATTLKGMARGYGLTAFEWDPGDGSPPIEGSIDDSYAIEAGHTYDGDVGDVFTATLTVWGAFGWSDSDTYAVQLFTPIHGVQKDAAIDEGLWYLHKAAHRYRTGGLAFAEWGGGNRVAEVASAIQAFQVQGHRLTADPLEDPYAEDVERGWNTLFTYARLDPVTIQAAGDPDGDGDGVGIGMYDGYGTAIYESGLAMMALASSGTPGRVARTGPPVYVHGQTYGDIVQDMADWFAWGQNDADPGGEHEWARGGWRYQPNSGDSDNSNTQFPVLGLAAAEDNWGITVPEWVKDELRDYWLAYTQGSSGGFGYMSPDNWLNVGKTGAGIMDLAWTGVPVTDTRIISASKFIENHWYDEPDGNWNGNIGEMYAMYAVKKGSHLAGIQSYGEHLWDYEYSAYLVDVQQPDGRFDDAGNFGPWQPMATSWALLILSPGLYQPLPVAIISPIQYGATEPEWLEGLVHFDGSASHHTDPDRELVAFEWAFGDGGTASGTLTPTHVYGDNGVYTVSLAITDDMGGVGSDTLLLTVDNVSPTVGPISAPPDPVQLGAEVHASADFTDPGVLDTHTAVWSWGDGTVSPGLVKEVGGSGTVTATHAYTMPGVYTLRLTVTDKDGGAGESEFRYLVVYDPEGGFVTGGGWIDSPEGAYAPDPSLTGRATFGFVAKYKRGASVPTGQTEFQFHVASLNFHSDTYDWLVVAGARAQFKGTGTINGEGNYGFVLTAIDAALTPSTDVDLFRIKIWDRDNGDAIVYDNQMGAEDGADLTTAIGGGSIVIHSDRWR